MEIVISLGGSLIVPKEIKVAFLKKFRSLIVMHIKKGKRFIIICGGGNIGRGYQKAASSITKLSDEDLDWLGIHATRLNAQLLKSIFKDYAHKYVVKNPTEKIDFMEKILIACGWKPGCSTDYDAILLAKNFNVKTIINLTNIDYVYDKDPRKYKDAKAIKEIKWQDFRRLIGRKWEPGLNAPFDPVAAEEAERLKLRVVILGPDINNLDNFLKNNNFKGTTIS